MNDPNLTARIRVATKGQNTREVSYTTGVNRESVRRYLKGGKPSVEFIRQVCLRYNVLADWLILGEGPRTREELKSELLADLDSDRFAEAWAERFARVESRLIAIEHILTTDRSLRSQSADPTPTETGGSTVKSQMAGPQRV